MGKHSRARKFKKDKRGRFAGSIPERRLVDPPIAFSIRPSRSDARAEDLLPAVAVYDSYRSAHAGSAPDASQHSAVRGLISEVAADLDLPDEEVQSAFEAWREADHLAYEDRAAPGQQFRYDLRSDVPDDAATKRALRKLGYEHFLKQRHPVFVYGTLRTGQGNSVLLDRARVATLEADMPGVVLYTKHWGFPYALESDSLAAVTRGEIVWLDGPAEPEVRRSLDYLEGFDSDWPSSSHYERVEKEISYLDPNSGRTTTTRVWMYFARGTAARSLREEDRLASGDWVFENSRRR